MFEFINNEAIPGTNIDAESFWSQFSETVHNLSPINKALIKREKTYKQNWTNGINLIKKKISINLNI